MVAITTTTTERTFTWAQLLLAATGCEVALLIAAGIILGDREPFGLAVATLIGTAILRTRANRIGAAVLGLLFANVGFWTLLAAASNLVQYRGPLPLGIPLSLATTSLVGMVA